MIRISLWRCSAQGDYRSTKTINRKQWTQPSNQSSNTKIITKQPSTTPVDHNYSNRNICSKPIKVYLPGTITKVSHLWTPHWKMCKTSRENRQAIFNSFQPSMWSESTNLVWTIWNREIWKRIWETRNRFLVKRRKRLK